MSSEAAQKAFPDLERGDDERYDDFEVRETIMAYSRAAFDRGAVEALRQAAAELDASAEWVEGSFMAGPNSTSYAGHTREAAERLRQMADEWAVGAMSTRDELANALALQAALDWADDETIGQFGVRLANTVHAEGWRKKPSRDEVARAIAWGVDGVDGEQFDEAAVDYRLEMLQGADAVLALMDRGQ